MPSTQFSSVTQSCPTLCNPMDCSTPGFLVHYQLLEFAQTHVHRVGDGIQPSHPLSSPSSPAFNLSQHQDLFQRVGHEWATEKQQQQSKFLCLLFQYVKSRSSGQSVLEMNRANRMCVCVCVCVCVCRERGEEMYQRNWCTWLWRMRSHMICSLQAGEPGKPVCNSVQIPRPENQEHDVGRLKMFVSAQAKSKVALPCCSIHWMMPTHVGKDSLCFVYWFKC